jgi:hypothetical protein
VVEFDTSVLLSLDIIILTDDELKAGSAEFCTRNGLQHCGLGEAIGNIG